VNNIENLSSVFLTQQLCKTLMHRYLCTISNSTTPFPDDDATPHTRHVTNDDVTMEDDPFLVMVKERVKSWTRALNQERNEVSEAMDTLDF